MQAKCEAERTLAARATFRLRQLVTGGGLTLTPVCVKSDLAHSIYRRLRVPTPLTAASFDCRVHEDK
jgi:hypothetical protein